MQTTRGGYPWNSKQPPRFSGIPLLRMDPDFAQPSRIRHREHSSPGTRVLTDSPDSRFLNWGLNGLGDALPAVGAWVDHLMLEALGTRHSASKVIYDRKG